MSQILAAMMLSFLVSSAAFAEAYSNEVQEALNQLEVSKHILSEFDVNSLPDFEQNPKEQAYLPTQQGELEQQGKQFVTDNQAGQYLKALADTHQGTSLDNEAKDKGQRDLENHLNDDVACVDGSCIVNSSDESHDFADGAVQMGALNGIAEEVGNHQASESMPAIFKAKNLTCRVVYKKNRFNFCQQDHDGWGSRALEKELHKAQREGLAILAYSATYCSQVEKILGHKTCVEKSQSWCVFQSKLAKLIQIEARRQLGMNFGYVGGYRNQADCRGLTPEEIAGIQFDTPQMQQALQELAQTFDQKKRLPEPSSIINRINEQVNAAKGEAND